MKPVMTLEQIHTMIQNEFPQQAEQFEITEVRGDGVSVRMFIGEEHLRPGGTISGPTMFTLADCAFYYAILAMIGPKLLTVTTSAQIDFMRKPAPGDLIGEARILKLGKALVVGDVVIHSVHNDKPVARASVTYSIPPQ